MKRIYFILIILFSFGQAEAQDKVDFLRTKVDGNRNIVDARLRLSHSLNIPRGASWSLNGAKDSIGYVMFNTTLQRFGVYHGSGVWKAYATIDEIDLLLDGKVDTIHGKGLSTEDYTTAEKSKLAGIAAGAEVNVNADWLAVSGDAQILNKPTFVATESDPVFLAQKGAVNGVATLNSSGKIPNAQIPALALVDTYVTASQAAMLALSTAEQGDVAIRTDVSKTFILTDNNYSTLASWSELLSPIIPAETDPIWGASPSAGITGTDISNWNIAYGWGNHSGIYLPFTGGTLTGALTITSNNSPLIINSTTGNYSHLMHQYGGVTKGVSGYNVGNMYYGGEAGIGTIIQSNGSTAISVNTSLQTTLIGSLTGTSFNFTGTGVIQSGLSVGTALYQNYSTIYAGGSATIGSAQYAIIADAAMSGVNNTAILANAKIRASTSSSNAYGIFVTNPEMGAGASVSNAYGLYISNQTSGGTSNYSIYSAGGANYFAGGLTLPSIKITNGATNGYVLKSDAVGNGTWQATTSSYKGTWNASTNNPTVADGTGTTGDYYEVSTSGTQFGRSFVAGGRAIYNGTIWEPVGISASVTSVNGYTGVVSLARSDVGLGSVDNTSDATKNSATATLTNKTISGSTNTLSNIAQSSVTNLTTDIAALMPKAGGVFTGGITATTIDISGSFTSSNSIPFVLSSPTTIDFHQSSAGTIRFINDAFNAVNLSLTNAGDMTVRSSITAASFIGPGTGLTGTASALTAGIANSVAWTNVTSRPTALSQFTNDLGNYGGWITGINSSMVTTALGYTPSNSTYTTSGIATPTFSPITNISTYTGYDNHYIRVGNEVTVRGKFLLGPTSTGLTVIRISFPTSPDPTRGADSASGSASGIGIASGVINMHVGSNSAELSMNASTTFPNEVYYDFTYTAL